MAAGVVSEGAGRLFVVSTPIGNLGDMSFRAVEVLRGADLILAEDTRHSRTLLTHYAVTTPVEALHEHNEASATARVLGRLRNGARIALISDAGTPLLSDPGARLVRAATDEGIVVEPVPGASALLAALVGSGIPADRFTFYGFLERKGRERAEAIAEISGLTHTAVVYEAPARVAQTLADLEAAGCSTREVVVARELTKHYEEYRRGTVGSLAAYYSESPPRGEVVIVLAGRTPTVVGESELRELAHALRAEGLSPRDVAAALVRTHGASRNLAYRLSHEA